MVPLLDNFSFLFDGLHFSRYEFDSIIEVFEEDFIFPRLLGCSSDFVVPVNLTSRLLLTSTDVIHSFSLPVLGLKVDALPGRLNQLFTTPSRVGVFYGQCSEICGSNHSFMPIRIKVVDLVDYDNTCKVNFLDLLGEGSFKGVLI